MLLKVKIFLDKNSKNKENFTVSKPCIENNVVEFKIYEEDNYTATELAISIISFAESLRYNTPKHICSENPNDSLFDDYDYAVLSDSYYSNLEELLEPDRKHKIPYNLEFKEGHPVHKKSERKSNIVYILHENLSECFFKRLIYQLELKNIVAKGNTNEILKFAYKNYKGKHNTLSRKDKLLIAAYRDYYHLVRLPTNVVNPDSLVQMFTHIISEYGLSNNVVFREQIVDCKSELAAIYAVGKGSEYKPRLLVVEFGNTETEQNTNFDIAICGKGVCYDTGGLSLKHTQSMVDMYTDKGGAVLGFLSAVTYYKLYKKPILYAAGIVENSIGPNSYRPGDVINSYSNNKIHIGNTDAEGRVVLADVLSYVTTNYVTKYVLTNATLTGAAKVVCGEDYCPYVIFENGNSVVFSDGNSLENIIDKLKVETGEYLVKLPSENLFVKNYVENAGRYGHISNVTKHRCEGSHGPAHFLNYFVKSDSNNNKPTYIHMDVANYFEKGNISSSDLLEFNVKLYDKLNS